MQENVVSLENAKGLAEKVKELSSEDPSINKDLDENIQKVEAPLNELISALNARQSELQTALLQSQELRDSVDELSNWLSAAENLLNLQGPLSARHKVIIDQQDKLQVCNAISLFHSKRENVRTCVSSEGASWQRCRKIERPTSLFISWKLKFNR